MNRRDAIGTFAVQSATIAGCAAPASGKPAFVLVHGAWHGAWCWDRVRPLLGAAAHEVHTPTLPGMGERAAELTAAIDLSTHIESVAAYIDARCTGPVILVGHSYAGSVISGVADRIPVAIRQLVYFDSVMLDSGQSLRSIISPTGWDGMMTQVRQLGGGIGIPPLPPAAFGVTAPDDASWVAARMTLQPLATFEQPLLLRNPLGNGRPKTYIDCNQPAMPSQAAFKNKVRDQPGWRYETLASAHEAMVISPQALADLLLQLV